MKLDTAVDLALLADMYDAKNLKDAALHFMIKNKDIFEADPSWREKFSKSMLAETVSAILNNIK